MSRWQRFRLQWSSSRMTCRRGEAGLPLMPLQSATRPEVICRASCWHQSHHFSTSYSLNSTSSNIYFSSNSSVYFSVYGSLRPWSDPDSTTTWRSSLSVDLALCIFKLFGNLLPKGEKCIDHRLRERVFCFFVSLAIWYLVDTLVCAHLILYVCVWDTRLIMCLIISYLNACAWMMLLFISHIWPFTLLGDECMFLIVIILSAPPRCMWHGRVTQDPNSLCICSPKQILRHAQI